MQSPLTLVLVVFTLLSICNSQTFTWISGNRGVGGSALWGIKGVGSPNNRPPPKGEVFTWIDNSNALWLFGGISTTRTSNVIFATLNRLDYWSDLWKFKDGNWTWISGPTTTNEVGNYGQKGIASPSNEPPSRSTGASWKTNDGTFWLYGGNSDYGKYSDVWKFDGVYWTWVVGSNETNIPARYVSKGTPDKNSHPGADRYFFPNWVDSSGNLWIFGGVVEFQNKWFSDLWRLNLTSGDWTWVSGSSENDLNATWGTQGIPNINNLPEPRYGAATWVDSLDNLWMFGGSGVGFSTLSSLWKFDGTAWTWVSGSQSPGARGIYGTKGIPNTNNHPGARIGSVVAKDLQDNIWMFGGLGIDGYEGYGTLNDLWRFNATIWTWMYGTNSAWNAGNYGTILTPSAGTLPPGRNPAGAWVDNCNTFWIFGGWAFNEDYYNDLWRYGSFSGLGVARCDIIEVTSSEITSGEVTTSIVATSSIVTSGRITSGIIVATSGVLDVNSNSSSEGGDSSGTKIIIAIVCSILAVIVITLILVAFLAKKIYSNKETALSESGIPEVALSGVNPIETRFDLLTGVTKLKQIGSGFFGDVFCGKLNNVIFVALKSLKNAENIEAFLQEAETLRNVSNSPFVVKFFGIYLENSIYYMVLEYMNKGDLLSYLRKKDKKLKVEDLNRIAWKASRGMRFLSEQGVLHRDVADVDGSLIIKISDFGMSKFSETYYSKQERPLPIRWCAIEVLTKRSFSLASDIWSFGVVLFEIYSLGEVPFGSLTSTEIVDQIRQGERLKKPNLCPDNIWDLASQCWIEDPAKRISIKKLEFALESFSSASNTHLYESVS